MSYYIATAGDLLRDGLQISEQEWSEICRHALPKGFRYIVSADHEIVEPALLFIYDQCIKPARVQSVGNTQKSYTDDLYEWFSYLKVIGLRWDEVVGEDIVQYRETLLTSISPLTRSPYKISTVKRRISTVQRFYKWTQRKGLSDSFEDIDDTDLAPQHDGGDSVDAIGADDLVRILDALGPLPARWNGTGTSSYRMAASLAVGAGLRLHEVAGLTVWHIRNIRPLSGQAAVSIVITKTKGKRPRRIFIPNTIYEDLIHYIENERQQCVVQGIETDALFLNHMNSTRNPGRAMTGHTIWRNFREAVISVGLVFSIPVTEDDKTVFKTVAQHHFHDLRHTYAVVMYYQLKNRGKSAPWLVLSRLLGHKYVATTVQIYLRSIDGIEAEVTDKFNEYMRVLRNA